MITDRGPAPKVSVVSITCNHEEFIHQALDGFVAQQTEFPVEVIVADDASSDQTPAIIKWYADRHPELFRPILRTENIGIHGNLTDALSIARGQYIALCEGDDYWTDPSKLTKQVTYLDQHPNTSVCFHPVQVIWSDGREKDSTFPPTRLRRDLSVAALMSRNFIQTNSVVYRRMPLYDDIPVDVMPLDWYLHVRHAACGDIAMLPETMAVYRRHAKGFWTDAKANRAKFWASRGAGHAAMFEAMLDLFPSNPTYEAIVARMADTVLSEIARIPGVAGRTALLNTITQYPRFAMLALEYRWGQTAKGRLNRAVAQIKQLRSNR